MQAAEPRKLRLLQAGNHPEDIGLGTVFQLRLEADNIVKRTQRIVLPQLDHGIGLDRGIVGIGQAHRLHRSMTQGLGTAFRHHLDRQAAIEIGNMFPFLEDRLLAFDQRVHKCLVLVLVHRAVDIILAGATRPDLVVPRLEPGNVHVDRIAMNDRCDGIEEGKRSRSRFLADGFGKPGRRQRSCSDDDIVPLFGRKAGHFLANHRDQRLGFDRSGYRIRKAVAIDRESAACGHLVAIGRRHDQRSGEPHFRMQNAHRTGGRIIRAKRIRADQFGKAIGLVGVGHALAAHFVEDHGNAAAGNLPGRFRAGETAADYVDGGGCVRHVAALSMGFCKTQERLCAWTMAGGRPSLWARASLGGFQQSIGFIVAALRCQNMVLILHCPGLQRLHRHLERRPERGDGIFDRHRRTGEDGSVDKPVALEPA